MNDNEPTTDWGDDWVEPDVYKRFGVKKPGTGCFVAVCVVVLLVILAALAFWVIGGL